MIILYPPDATDFTTLGEIVLQPDSCTVTEKAGGRFDLTLTHPITPDGRWQHLRVDALIKAPAPVRDPAGGTGKCSQAREQLFRIDEVTVEPDEGRVTAEALHVSYDLRFGLITACDLSGAADVAGQLALMKAATVGAYPGTVTATLDGLYEGDISWRNPVRALLDPEEGIGAVMKAQVLRDNWDWFLLPNLPVDRGVTVRYGKNLRGVRWTTSAAELVTRIVPASLEGDERRLLPEKAVVSAEDGIWSLPRVALLDAGRGLTEEQLRSAAQEVFASGCDTVLPEVTVDLIMPGDTAEYAAYRDLQQLFLYDEVTVEHAPTGLKCTSQVCGYEWDALLGRYTGITLGSPFQRPGSALAGFELPADPATANRVARMLMNSAAFRTAVRELSGT